MEQNSISTDRTEDMTFIFTEHGIEVSVIAKKEFANATYNPKHADIAVLVRVIGATKWQNITHNFFDENISGHNDFHFSDKFGMDWSSSDTTRYTDDLWEWFKVNVPKFHVYEIPTDIDLDEFQDEVFCEDHFTGFMVPSKNYLIFPVTGFPRYCDFLRQEPLEIKIKHIDDCVKSLRREKSF